MKYGLKALFSNFGGDGDTMLEAVDNADIFRIRARDDGTFHLLESCGDSYEVVLTKEQLLQLAKELVDLAEGRSK